MAASRGILRTCSNIYNRVFLAKILNSFKGIPEFLDSGRKSWTLDSGHRTLDAGLWMLDFGPWTLNAGLWMLDSGCSTLDAELWALDSGCWTLDTELWT